ncbi:TPA: ATP-binding cassette domain-containing protein [Neisseria meningitidis]
MFRHNGEILLSGINIKLKSGDSLLIRGPSGCGRTSLLRALAGLWPFGSSGKVSRPPHQDILFLPQRPYTAQGSLRDAVCYPDIDKQHPELIEAMNTCRLGYLIDKLDKTDDWQHKLSLGELQRVALDEPAEAALYRALKQKLPDSIIISIGHRSTLNAFHNMRLDVGNVACG